MGEVRSLLCSHCMSTLGRSRVGQMSLSADAGEVNKLLEQTREMRRIEDDGEDFPLLNFFDMRDSLKRVRLEGTYMDEEELFHLMRSLDTTCRIVSFLKASKQTNDTDGVERVETGDTRPAYPALSELCRDIMTFPQIVKRVDQIIDKFGKMRDTASPELANIRHELARTEGNISRTLMSIMRAAQNEGLVDKDLAPTVRDGRLVIPVAPAMKRRIQGIVHDESATGKTVFIEPAQVVEANNRVRELEAEERREVIRLLTELSREIRPHVNEMLRGYGLLADIDFTHAKAAMARSMHAVEPTVLGHPYMDWQEARHPLLEISLAKQGKRMVPLDIMLTAEKHILIISGPNAGGKSVCLKTAGLLQYMVQCGLSIPVGEHSRVGLFSDLMIDIGDEQSLENDLSTYSSHLLNMKNMMRRASCGTLLLIDEFGTGTEPQIGGAIAESVLKQFLRKGAYGIITTHYQNLKHYADSHDGIANGAMLYDRQGMRPLFQLAIGRPGSSFAIEIARNIGLPEEVIADASEIVGSDYIQSDKYLQDIVRDKRYWENKRQAIHEREKHLEQTIQQYEKDVESIEHERKELLRRAKAQAEELLAETNRRIENAIREIREAQAEKEQTKAIRKELAEFSDGMGELDTKANDDLIAKKIEQIKRRRERHQQRLKEKAKQQSDEQARAAEAAAARREAERPLSVGDATRIKGTQTVGRIESIDGNMATVIFGDMRTKTRLVRLEHVVQQQTTAQQSSGTTMSRLAATAYSISKDTRDAIDERKRAFKPDLDVRGMCGDEAINAVTYFVDDAILLGMSRVRILHGKGNGILRQLIRQYLHTVPAVSDYRDEDVRFGGAGITVVEMG